jgi:hypothetical protein
MLSLYSQALNSTIEKKDAARMLEIEWVRWNTSETAAKTYMESWIRQEKALLDDKCRLCTATAVAWINEN